MPQDRITSHTAARPAGALQEMPIDVVWDEYRRTGSDALRDRLVRQYLPIVRFLAQRLGSVLAGEVDLHDLVQDGCCGLMDAIDAFDPSQGIKFETFCPKRIRGAMIDALRSSDFVSRLKREREKKCERVRQRFYLRCGRYPTDEEILPLLNANPAQARRILEDGRPIRVLGLDRPRFDRHSNREEVEAEALPDHRRVEPLLALRRSDLKAYITRNLTRAERLILILYYYEEMTMKDIGRTLELSESRVSQMHASIMARLKAICLHQPQEFDGS